MKDLREFINVLEEKGELLRVKEELEPRFEISGFLRILLESGNNKAVFFENVKGYQSPVVGNVLGTKRRLAYAFGVEEDEVGSVYLERRKKPVEPELVADGPVKEVKITRDVDILREIPVLTHHEGDAGPYLTSSIVITAKDPKTGTRGMGIHRMQVKGKNRLGVFIASPPLSLFLKEAEEKGRPLEVAVVNGVDPITFFASVIFAPQGEDKFAIAGALRGEPVRLVKCETVDLEVPAEAEFVLEGEIKPGVREQEGPFGESTGYYLTFQNPVIEVKAITRRKEPIYHALLPFSAEDTTLFDFAWEMEHLRVLQQSFPSVKKVHFEGNGAVMVVQMQKQRDEEPRELIEHVFQWPADKVIIVVDEDVNPYNWSEVMWAISTRTRPHEDVIVGKDLPGLMIDPTCPGGEISEKSFFTMVPKSSKLGIDATKPIAEREKFKKVDVPPEVRRRLKGLLNRYLGLSP